MKWYLIFMSFVALTVFSFLIFTIKIKQREQTDPVVAEKLERWRNNWDPKITFFENLFGWIFAALIIYYIYLG